MFQKIMGRYRSRMALRPINRIKHIIDVSATVTAGSTLDTVIAASTDTPTLAATTSVETAAKVNGFYLRVEVAPNETDAGAIPNVYMAVWKSPGGNITLGGINNLGDDDNKRFVIHQEMTMINNLAGGNPRTLFNGVIVVPKGMRRMGPNDVWNVSVRSTAVNIAFCLQCHYKEFR